MTKLKGDDGELSAKEHNLSIARALKRVEAKAAMSQEKGLWHPITHDRRVDLVYIGEAGKMDEQRIREAVEGALMTQQELREFLDGFTGKDYMQRCESNNPNNPFCNVPRCVTF